MQRHRQAGEYSMILKSRDRGSNTARHKLAARD
jgi:hypothetical protein